MRKITGKNRLADRRSALIQYYQGQVTLVIPAMLAEYKKRWCPYIEQRGAFKKLLQSMEESNANYPFGYMTNYYFRNFEHPTAPFYNGWFEFDKKNYHLLSEDEMKDLERKFKVDEITAEVKKSTQEIRDYVDGVVAKNAPIRRLKGMGEFYSELVAIRDEPWYYPEDVASQMKPKGEYICPDVHAGMGLKMPFHRKLYVKLEPMYETFDILETKLKRLKTVLDSISSDLAYSELQESTSEGTALGTQGIDKAARAMAPPKAFIAHGGKTTARDKLESFLTALGVIPTIVEDQPSEGRSKDKNVEYYLKQCDCAIILATKGDADGQTGEFIPRGNILNEIGRAQEILPDRMIYLLEEETKFPTNIDEKVWERFTQESMDKAFIKIAKELKAFGLIKAIKS
ncbi:hypothetical protein ES706_03887 [subsurface metagenome]|nr:hypothetical protein [Dehalococcoidia bacterium]